MQIVRRFRLRSRCGWMLAMVALTIVWLAVESVSAQLIHNPDNGHYYEVVFAPGMSWSDARNDANSREHMGMPGHLATVTSVEEHDFILSNVLPQAPLALDVWLGGFQLAGSPEPVGGWQWVTGEPVDAATFANWSGPNPDDFSGDSALMMLPDGSWDDRSQFDTSPSGYIIEYDIGPIHNPATGHYYQIVMAPTPLTWFDAEDAAKTHMHMGAPGHLATIESVEEQDFIVSSLLSQVPIDVWLGGFQEPGSPAPDQGWNWVTGDPFTFTNWLPGGPNAFASNHGLMMFSDGFWESVSRDDPRTSAYVVEFNPRDSSAPLCSEPVGMDMHYDAGTLRLDFHLETTMPATWEVWLMAPGEAVRFLSMNFPSSLTPSLSIPVAIPFVQPQGRILAVMTLSTPEHGIFCSITTAADTGPATGASALSELSFGSLAELQRYVMDFVSIQPVLSGE